MDLLAADREVRVATGRLDGGVWGGESGELHLPRAIAGLLFQLPFRGVDRFFSGLHHSARYFQGVGPDAGAELADEHDLTLRGDGDNVDPLRGFDHHPRVLAAVAR